MEAAAAVHGRPLADGHVGLLDEAVDGERGAAGELLVLDLLIEGLLAPEVPEPGEVPDDVVGETGEDVGVVAAAEAVEVPRDHRLSC